MFSTQHNIEDLVFSVWEAVRNNKTKNKLTNKHFEIGLSTQPTRVLECSEYELPNISNLQQLLKR